MEENKKAKAPLVDFKKDCLLTLDELSRNMETVPTGFKTLDKYLKGGLPNSLIVLGATSNIGKSTFALQLAQTISDSGTPVLYFSLEMAKYGIAINAIKREMFLRSDKNSGELPPAYIDYLIELKGKENGNNSTPAAKSDADFPDLDPEKKENLKKLFESSKKALFESSKDTFDEPRGRLRNMYIVERDSNIDKFSHETISRITTEFIEFLKQEGKSRTKPVVFIDYLQILAGDDKKRLDERQILDENIAKLWLLAKEKQIPVFAISSLNRASYYEPVAMSSFKGSGNIEYTADVILALQYSVFRRATKSGNAREPKVSLNDLNKARNRNPRELDLVVLKQRYGKGGADTVCPMLFYNDYSYFEETENASSDENGGSFTPASGSENVLVEADNGADYAAELRERIKRESEKNSAFESWKKAEKKKEEEKAKSSDKSGRKKR